MGLPIPESVDVGIHDDGSVRIRPSGIPSDARMIFSAAAAIGAGRVTVYGNRYLMAAFLDVDGTRAFTYALDATPLHSPTI